ncbi:response regulator [Ktedonobacter sp. SOSP1-52]|uniref:response regulator n=1 Tax=Ktedonobacter sp. SOSP1-52 TaxID=2778366 RepID=UPI00191622CC|nr:response regulator [Ktedonobacter sp. SOSP1-52]GHO62899.1 response regulator [Ktedonobacter sp. SOSP1-52]
MLQPREKAIHSAAKAVLFVEDDTYIGAFLVEAVREETSYQAMLAVTGAQALDLLHYLRPSLIVCDYRLPDMDGFTLHDLLRAREEFTNIPIILMSAMPQVMTRTIQHEKLLRLKKPFDLDTFLCLINNILE